MKKWLFFSIAVSVISLSVNAQDTLRQQGEIPLPEASFYNADVFGNLYLAQSEQLQKRDATGKLLATYSNPILGSIASVDLLNTMQPLAFFEEVNTLTILDNRLNESRQVTLNNLGFIDPVMVQQSDQDNVWIYDQQRDKLLRFSLPSQKVNAQSINLTQLLNSENRPRKLMANFNRLVLIVPQQGALLFDPLGSFIKAIPLPENAITHLAEKGLYYWHQQVLHYYSFKNNITQTFPLAAFKPRQIKVIQDTVYLFFAAKAVIYRKVKK